MISQDQVQERTELKKTLSPWQIGALALGCIVGWGCFVLPGTSFLPNAGPVATIIGFAIGAILLSVVALSYSELIEKFPVAGGEFAYAYAGFGPTAAYICGWALTLGYLSIVAINISAVALVFRFLLPGVFDFGYLYTIAGWDVFAGEVLLMSFVTIAFGIMNYMGASVAGTTQLILTFSLISCVGLLAFGVSTAETFTFDNLRPFFAEDKSALSCILVIVAISPFLFVGFDTVPQAAEEFSFSPKKARLIMLLAILFGGVLYSLVTFSVAGIIPYKELLAQKPAWATGTVANLAYGKIGSVILSGAVIGAVCTGMNGFYIATSRLILSIARSKFLPSWFAGIHPKHQTPHTAIIFTMLCCLLTPWAGRAVVAWIVDMCSVGTVIAYAFTCLTCYKVVQANPQGTALGKCTAICGAVISVAILALLITPGSPAMISMECWIIMGVWTVLGFLFYKHQMKVVNAIPELEIRESVFGTKDAQVFFLPKK